MKKFTISYNSEMARIYHILATTLDNCPLSMPPSFKVHWNTKHLDVIDPDYESHTNAMLTSKVCFMDTSKYAIPTTLRIEVYHPSIYASIKSLFGKNIASYTTEFYIIRIILHEVMHFLTQYHYFFSQYYDDYDFDRTHMIDSIEAFDHYEKFIDNAGSQDDEYNNERMTLNFLLGILFRKDINFDDLFLNRLLLPNPDSDFYEHELIKYQDNVDVYSQLLIIQSQYYQNLINHTELTSKAEDLYWDKIDRNVERVNKLAKKMHETLDDIRFVE